jgi:two-component system OmpR family sensor kinase
MMATVNSTVLVKSVRFRPLESRDQTFEGRMSIRTRLTLWYTAVLTVFIVAFGAVVYAVLAFNLVGGLDRTLRETAGQIIATARVRTFSDIPVIAIPELDVFGSNVYIQVVNASDEQVVRKSGNLQRFSLTLDETGLGLVEKSHQPVTRNVRTGGADLRVLTIPLTVETQVLGYLQVAILREQVDRALGLLLVVLAAGGLAAIVASAVVGRLLAGRALEPIDTITQTAFAISRADDLDKRIPQVGPQDEVGRLARTFNIMLDRLEGLFRGQQRFIADISHELRTPLTTIRGNLDLMRRMGSFDQASLDAMQAETERMTRMVGDLLLLAQADAGQPIRRERVELDTLMLEVFRQMRPLAENIELSIGEEDQASVLGDADRLKQLLINLVDNAIKYTPNSGRVTLGLRRVESQAVLTVADTGIGIPEQDLPHIFERFYRVGKARSRAAGGSGLGLSIVQWIVQAHNGKISVTSQPGQGTTFTVWLPLAG